MKVKEALAELESLGTAQNRKVYARHGVSGDTFGVSYANIGKLVKKWKGDHELAVGLWDSGDHDARVVAAMIADGDQLTSKELDAWMAAVTSYPLADAFAGLVARTRHAAAKATEWAKAKGEWPSTVGWNLIAGMATRREVSDGELASRLEEIEARIDRAPNRTKYAMNTALISIGTSRSSLLAAANASAKRIGKVDVDHGETSCKTPDAVPYMKKVIAHQKRKAANQKRKAANRRAKAPVTKKKSSKAVVKKEVAKR